MNRQMVKRVFSLLCAIAIIVSSISIGIPATAEGTEVEKTSLSVPDPTLEAITFRDLGLENGIYTNSTNNTSMYSGNLDGKVVEGYVTFSKNAASLIIGGTNSWRGIEIVSNPNGYLDVKNTYTNETVLTMFESAIQASLLEKEFHLQISFQLETKGEDQLKNDLKLGIWINGKLYDNQYIYFEDYETAGESNLGQHCRIYCDQEDRYVQLDSDRRLDSNMEMVTFNEFGLEDGTYTNATNETAFGSYDGSLDGKVVAGYVNFSKARASLILGGNSSWDGIEIYTTSNAQQFCWSVVSDAYTKQTITDLYDSEIGISLRENEILLQLSFQLEDRNKDGKKNDLKLGVWIDGKLYDNQYIYQENWETGEGISQLGNFMRLYCPNDGSTIQIKSMKKLDTSMKKITFQNFGLDNGTYTNATNNDAVGIYAGGLDGKVLEGYVAFSENPASLIIGGTDSWKGIELSSDPNGYYVLKNVNTNQVICELLEHVAKTRFVGQEFKLQLSFQLEEKHNDGLKNDLKLGVWINDRLYNNEYLSIDNYETEGVSNLGKYMRVYCDRDDRYVTLRSVEIEPGKSEELDTSLQHISFSHFGISDGKYTKTETTDGIAGYYGNGLDGKVLGGNVVFSNGHAELIFSGTDSWKGLSLYSDYDTKLRLQDTYTKEDILILDPSLAGAQLCDNEFNLKLSMQLVDNQGEGTADDLKLGVWINNQLYNNEYVYINDYVFEDGTSRLGGHLRIFSDKSDRFVQVESEIVTPENPEELDTSLKHISFCHFGISDGKYAKTETTDGISGYYSNGLDGKVLGGNVVFSNDHVELIFSGTDSWKGLCLYSHYDAKLRLKDTYTQQDILILDPTIAKTNLCDTAFDLQLSMQLVDNQQDGTADDLKLGVWINDQLYNNEYVYINDYVFEDGTSRLGGHLRIFSDKSDRFIRVISKIVAPANPEKLDSSFKKISFSSFYFPDGIYDKENSESELGYYNYALHGKVLEGNVIFSEKTVELIFSGKDDEWQGLVLGSYGDGNLILKDTYTKQNLLIINSKVAGTKLVDHRFNLKLSFALVDYAGDGTADDLQIGVWINDKLYDNEYIYVDNYVFENGASRLGGYMRVYTETEGAYLKIESVDVELESPASTEKLDSSLKIIGFNGFGVEDGTYTKDNKAVGYCNTSLNGKVLSGMVSFSDFTAELIIGGRHSNWEGLILGNYGRGMLTLKDAYTKETLLEIKPGVAGTYLYGKEFNLKCSFQLVDHDADGITDDLKLGVWINNILYDDKYVYINDYVFEDGISRLGRHMNIYVENEKAYIKIKSENVPVQRIQGSIQAAPFTGDTTNTKFNFIVMILAAGLILSNICWRMKGKLWTGQRNG